MPYKTQEKKFIGYARDGGNGFPDGLTPVTTTEHKLGAEDFLLGAGAWLGLFGGWALRNFHATVPGTHQTPTQPNR